MGLSPDALWEVEGTSIDLRTVKIPQKRYPSRTLSIGTEVCLMVRYIWEKTDIWSLYLGNFGILVFIDLIDALL